MEKQNEQLTANNLKNTLWQTLQGVKTGSINCGQADAIASQAREILRTTQVQLKIASQAKRDIPHELITFSEASNEAKA